MADILIVGAGVAGLSAGIYAQMSGRRAVVCEKNPVPGGCLCGWRRGEYEIDNCIHWLTGTDPSTEAYRMWTDLGVLGGVETVRLDSLYTVEVDGRRLSLWRDAGRVEAEMLALSPRDADETRRFFRAVGEAKYLSGLGDTGRGEASLFRRAAALPRLAPYFRQTVGELADRFAHPLIREFLASLLTESFGAIALIFVFANFTAGNADLPRGGSAAAARRMARRFGELGGELCLNTEVVKINTASGRASSVTLSNGRVLGADHIVIAADPAAVFGKILDLPMPDALRRRYARSDLVRFSSFQCAFACPASALDFKGDLIFPLDEDERRSLGVKRLVLREFSHEPTFAPPGESVLQAMIFCDENACRQFISLRENEAEYIAVKARAVAAVKAAIERRFELVPGALRSLDSWTPATYKRWVGSEIGSYMSFAFGKNVLLPMSPPRVKGTDGLYLATQWLGAPGGLPIAAGSGRLAVRAIDAAEAKRSLSFRRAPAVRRQIVRG